MQEFISQLLRSLELNRVDANAEIEKLRAEINNIGRVMRAADTIRDYLENQARR